MPRKKEGELKFNFKVTTCTFSTDQVNQVTVALNLEGLIEKYGRVLGTLSCSPPARKNGAWYWCGVSYPESGISMSSQGHGKFDKVTASTWQTGGVVTMSDGHICEIEGVIDLDAHAWTGKMIEKN